MSYDYDLIVVGGGSGGMAAAKEAKACGAKNVALFDYVKPTIHGTKWGLGGTCVNVGCIPKKLMHYAGKMGPLLRHDAQVFGWQNLGKSLSHDWTIMSTAVQQYIKRLNFSYRVSLRTKDVKYINALAKFYDPHTILYTLNDKQEKVTAKNILIAVGGRPHVPEDVPGARELAITSDDIFWRSTSPGKTLVVGASYIALECAGFLTELGYDTTVAVRSILLRGFDRQCAEKIGQQMQEEGTKFKKVLPIRLEKVEASEHGNLRAGAASHAIKVTFADKTSEVYDTVIYATGRRPDLAGLNLGAAGLKVEPVSGKLVTKDEQTEVPHIYAVGDCIAGAPELTPVAIKAGELLIKRVYGKSEQKMDYKLVPTAVFTPMEYGCVGYSEEAAIAAFGEQNVETFLFEFPTLELAAAHREKAEQCRETPEDVDASPNSLCKLVCLKNENMRVIGFHFVGLNAGEICQGYALAIRCGATKYDFDNTVGIHPTDAEAFHSLTVTRRSGDSWVAAGGCGGGKCG